MAYEDSAIVQQHFDRQRAVLREPFEALRAEQARESQALVASVSLRYSIAQDKAREKQAELGPGFLVLAHMNGNVTATPLQPRYLSSAEAAREGEMRAEMVRRQEAARKADYPARRLAQLKAEDAARQALVNNGKTT
jgi:hypothetical protein